jgi:RimJ/RimL family protein N-acetyltransferase
MSGYFGTDLQQRLQALSEASVEFINSTPGACQTARMMGCDDPDALGWDRIDFCLQRDGVFGFRMISAEQAGEIRSRLAQRNCRFDTWDVFLASRDVALDVCEAILVKELPAGLRELERPRQSEDQQVSSIQTLMGSAGVVPFSGSFLVGDCGPAITVAIGDGPDNAIAAAHGYLPHNVFSPFHHYAWGGLVVVAESCRGAGLGANINARLVSRAFSDLGATHIYELVSATNLPSRRMVEACGLRHEPHLICGVATVEDAATFTR